MVYLEFKEFYTLGFSLEDKNGRSQLTGFKVTVHCIFRLPENNNNTNNNYCFLSTVA